MNEIYEYNYYFLIKNYKDFTNLNKTCAPLLSFPRKLIDSASVEVINWREFYGCAQCAFVCFVF